MRSDEKIYFLICSNVIDDVISFANSTKNTKSKYLENEIYFFALEKN